MAQSVLFDELTYKCESKHNNLIAFQVDVGLLLRVFRSATANCQFGEGTIEVKLSQRNVAGAVGGDGQAKPFLTFTARVRDRGGACMAHACI
jgi:HUS1 checkpoint protein